jgi:transketolase
MRREFSTLVDTYLETHLDSYFITGDLGFDAFEGIRDNYAERFINAGVAEQNMLGVASGLAYTGSDVFVYSIAPFCVYRCLEQIKIDVCMHELPVYIVGNGGGYGYGIMGATHHAIEDIACMSCLPNMTCWVPAFKEDLQYCFERMTKLRKPGYLRLAYGDCHDYIGLIEDINQISKADVPRLTIVVMGPVIQNVLNVIQGRNDIDLFSVLTIPMHDKSDSILESIKFTSKLLIIEEHVKRGGFSEYFISYIIEQNYHPDMIISLHAKGYPSKRYGSQKFHQEESELDSNSIYKTINEMLS